LFLEKYNTYLPDKGSPCRKIILSRNFRSRREVIDAVNFLFKQIMSTGAGELDYTDAEALNFGAVFDENAKEDITVGGEVEFHLIQTEDEDKNFTFENEGEKGGRPTKEKRMRKCWTASSVKQGWWAEESLN